MVGVLIGGLGMAMLHGISCAVQRHYSTVTGPFGSVALLALKKESCIHEVQTKFICKTFFTDGCSFSQRI